MVAKIHARLYAALLASFCVLGLCLTFAQPVFSLPDEPAHWMSANVRLEHLFGTKGCIPTLLGDRCPDKICSALPNLTLTCIDDLGLYGDLFSYPGVLISKLVLPRQTESAIRQAQAVVLSRLLQGLIVLLCLVRVGFLARRTGRFGGLTLAAFALSPLLAQQAFAVSSDGAQLGFGLCLFAIVMFWEALTRLDALMFVLLGYASTSKPTVLPLVLPAVFAGYWFFQAQQKDAGLLDAARGILRVLKPTRRPSAQTVIAWSALLLSVLTVIFSLSYDAEGQAGVDSEDTIRRVANMNLLRERPFFVVDLLSHLHYSPAKLGSWLGPLGWLDSRLSAAVVHAFGRIFCLCFGLELCALGWFVFRRRSSLEGAGRRLLRALPGLTLGLLGVLVNVLFVVAVMYVLWTPANLSRVHGVQIRYFFPATMVLVGLLFRTLEGLALTQGERAFALPPKLRWVSVAAPCLVLALSLPYVSRLYVDLSLRYHNPAFQPHP